MTQKVIEVVGTSKESFAKAAENAVREAAKTVRGMKWARVEWSWTERRSWSTAPLQKFTSISNTRNAGQCATDYGHSLRFKSLASNHYRFKPFRFT